MTELLGFVPGYLLGAFCVASLANGWRGNRGRAVSYLVASVTAFGLGLWMTSMVSPVEGLSGLMRFSSRSRFPLGLSVGGVISIGAAAGAIQVGAWSWGRARRTPKGRLVAVGTLVTLSSAAILLFMFLYLSNIESELLA